MPRTARSVKADGIYHVLNRGNGRMTLFHKSADFDAFCKVLTEGLQRYPVKLHCYCLMTNHWHLVLQPRTDDALGALMGWIGVTHVRRHHAHYHTAGGGHLYQGRFKSFAVESDDYFLTLCRYVEANPLLAKLVERAQDWAWSSLSRRDAPPLSAWPLDRPGRWTESVNRSIPERELDRIRTPIQRDRPYGSEVWIKRTAKRLGVEYTLRDRGRPKAARALKE